MAMELKQILLRGDTSAAWIAANPILAAREMAIDTTEHRVKVGDGASAWTSLPWSSMAASEVARLEAAADALVGAASPTDAVNEGLFKDPASKTAQAVTDMIGTVGGAAFATKNGAAQTIDAQTTFTSLKGLRSSTYFGLGAGIGSARMPHFENLVVDGSNMPDTLAAPGGDDYVGVQLNVTHQGGFAGRKTNLVGSISSGSTTLTLSSGTFNAPVIVGYTVSIPGAGSGGGTLKTKIAEITDPTTAKLQLAASTTVSNASIIATMAADHNFVFGWNLFGQSGASAGALSGIDNVFGLLAEYHLRTPNAVLGTVKATSSELAIESTATGSTVGLAIGHHIKAIANKSNAVVSQVRGLYVEAPTAAGTAETWTAYVQGGASWLSGATRIGGEGAVGQVPLVVQRPLGATAVAFEVRDFTLANRYFSIGGGGAAASVSFITAFEGLGAQTQIGAVTGGFAGIRFGSAGTEIRQHTTGGVQIYNAKSFGVPAVTTANRLSAANAGAGAVSFDTTLGKPIFSDGTNWKDATGVTV